MANRQLGICRQGGRYCFEPPCKGAQQLGALALQDRLAARQNTLSPQHENMSQEMQTDTDRPTSVVRHFPPGLLTELGSGPPTGCPRRFVGGRGPSLCPKLSRCTLERV